MARRGRKRRLELEAAYWRLLAGWVGSVETCRQLGIGQDGLPVAGGKWWPSARPPDRTRGVGVGQFLASEVPKISSWQVPDGE
jgi:hypothetical protein